MRKEDKEFILKALANLRSDLQSEIKGIKNDLQSEIKGIKNDLQSEIKGIKNDLQSEIKGVKNDLQSEIKGVKDELWTEIRHNGVLIESVQSSVDWLVESNKTLHERVGRLEDDVTGIKENISDLPAIRAVVKRHSRELAGLRR